MPTITHPISQGGPFIECFVSVSQPRQEALRKAHQTIPSPIRVRALVDTGASCTCVDPRIVKHLQLSLLSTTKVHTPSTQGNAHSCGVYDAAIYIVTATGNHSVGTLPVVETHLTLQGFDMLLGRDVLNKCVLVYDGVSGTFSLSI